MSVASFDEGTNTLLGHAATHSCIARESAMPMSSLAKRNTRRANANTLSHNSRLRA